MKTLGSVSFLHMRHENLYIVATSRANVNAALVFTFLSNMLKIFKAYFGQINEESVKENFVLIQELIDGLHPCHARCVLLFGRLSCRGYRLFGPCVCRDY